MMAGRARLTAIHTHIALFLAGMKNDLVSSTTESDSRETPHTVQFFSTCGEKRPHIPHFHLPWTPIPGHRIKLGSSAFSEKVFHVNDRAVLSGNVSIFSRPAAASMVVEDLWVGSAPPIGHGVSKLFDCLVLSAIEYQVGKECFHGVEVVRVPLNDDGSPITWEEMAGAV